MSYIPRIKLECVKYVVKVRQSSSCCACGSAGIATSNNVGLHTFSSLTIQRRQLSTLSQLLPKPPPARIKVKRSGGRKEVDQQLSNDHGLKSQRSPGKRILPKDASQAQKFPVAPKPRTLSKGQREQASKVKKEELNKIGKETSFNKNFLGYVQTCLFLGDRHRAWKTLQYYRQRQVEQNGCGVKDVAVYNTMLHGFAAEGNLSRVKDLVGFVMEDGLKPTPQTFAAVIECMGRNPLSKTFKRNMTKTIQSLEEHGYTLDDLFNKTTLERDQKEVILKTIQLYKPGYFPIIKEPVFGYSCRLLQGLNQQIENGRYISPATNLISVEELEARKKEQFRNEIRGIITIKSIEEKSGDENIAHFRALLTECEEMWTEAVKTALSRNMAALAKKVETSRQPWAMSLYPYLKVLAPEEYVDIILREIRKIAEGSETYSPGVQMLYRELGIQVENRFQTLQKHNAGILNKIKEMYSQYLRWYLSPGSETSLNTREKWQRLTYERATAGPDIDVRDKEWSSPVLSGVGRFLYEIIMNDIKVDANVLKSGQKPKQLVPAFYSIFRSQGFALKEEIKPHPVLVKLFLAASRNELSFKASELPMLVPPLPWISIRTGGYLLSAAKLVRLPFMAYQQPYRMENCVQEQLYPALDCLNQLSAVPWKINEEVLDVLIEVFNNKGNAAIAVPPPPSECPAPPTIDPSMTKAETLAAHKERLLLKRRRAEMYSLWCDALYRLSLANHFRKDIFWLPHNMDFRGRVYPCPPHLTHLGADPARAILVFAKGEPLGENGLDWLKIHCINLTGLKKRNSVADRLTYANQIMDLILDSAERPLTGSKWWMESDEPWQTLSCCMEIKNALKSGDPASFVSHYPIHQDGSCNGLQHYAALGRDQAGAESVNLAPSVVPQDVYSNVAALVERLRQKDAEDGVLIAQTLEGHISRRVVKQTVMTTVYGVTRYGARLQIQRQLKDLPDFPKDLIWQASTYLTQKTFESLGEMFTSAKQIQDWFTECARVISSTCGQNVEWVTPLGLPVVQPYFRLQYVLDPYNPVKVAESHRLDMYERPNVMKQKNAFPPNYIHSLDSSHMMLTSLHCERAGMTFVSVHDCYWTHPKTVQLMNKICREQFVALHSEPILEDLSKFLVERYSYGDVGESEGRVREEKIRLNEILKAVPPKGTFELKNVLDSTYFFS